MWGWEFLLPHDLGVGGSLEVKEGGGEGAEDLEKRVGGSQGNRALENGGPAPGLLQKVVL